MVSITAEIVSFSWETWIPLELPLRPEDEFIIHSILNVSNEVWLQVIQMSGSEQHIAWTTHAIWEDMKTPSSLPLPPHAPRSYASLQTLGRVSKAAMSIALASRSHGISSSTKYIGTLCGMLLILKPHPETNSGRMFLNELQTR